MARGVGGHSPANVQKFLKGQEYPARKNDLLKTAHGNHAPEEIIETIQGLPDEEFGGPQDVMKGYGEEEHQNNPAEEHRSHSRASSEHEHQAEQHRAKPHGGQHRRD